MNYYKHWTPEEDEVLRGCLLCGEKNPYEKVSKITGRDIISCRNRAHKLKEKGFYWGRERSHNLSEEEFKEVANILRKEIKNSPGNLQEAFKKTAEKVPLTCGTIQRYWYNSNTPISRNNIGLCFTTLSDKKTLINKKVSNSKELPSYKCIWQRILKLFNHDKD